MTKIDQGSPVGHYSDHGLWKPPEATSSAPRKDFPQFQGRLFLSQCTPYSRIQEWCIYRIIYHYAPFLLRNPMVTFSGPNYMIQNEVPNPSPILKEDLSAISVWQFPGDYQKTIWGPQPPGPAGVGLSILMGTILRAILRGYQSFQLL
ncbi:hypothetical protein O181_101150 [Austropuccinia psidii MF-1]|uniref:Uncharacterized protein n=1 Tax=Austropuccinia psidii MF-1 TaxID=1389203 RepID=A0A9Q3JDX1_9BASI|nr:hypothetical protein [Austropuccinia psidii MF-1]